MNFPPFGNHFPGGIPSIHGFAGMGKFNHGVGGGGGQDGGPPTSASTTTGVGTQTSPVSAADNGPRYGNHFPGQQVMAPGKYHRDSSTQITSNLLAATKYDMHQSYMPSNFNGARDKRGYQDGGDKRDGKEENGEYPMNLGQVSQPGMPPSWQSIAAPGSTVADYLSHLPASTLPISLHHFLKYSAENIKKDESSELNQDHLGHHQGLIHHAPHQALHPDLLKKKKKKKPPKEKKPRPKPGEIRLTTALDGSTLYCCPECHMAYPDKALLEQHLLGHTMERRFFCDICGAGLKRKDHLTRHKQSHNPERPFVCTVCMKAFKRKEQLTLHFVIHSGEKRHVCSECGKGFYRKDHLRKHARSHIARRVKAELSQHVPTTSAGGGGGQSSSATVQTEHMS